MKPFELQQLEEVGFFSRLLSGKPTGNGWKEVNNILADANDAFALSEAALAAALKKWGAKMDEESMEQRSSMYRKFADVAYAEASSLEDTLLAQCQHLAAVLQLPPHLVKLAEKGAKTAAYFTRCGKILTDEEKLTINEINSLFGYDYEDGLSIRKQVFQNHFNMAFEDYSKARRFSPEQEEGLRKDCQLLDIPYEFKNNIQHALDHFRELWKAENGELGTVDVDLPLKEGEICRAYANAGLCQKQMVEREDNYFELTRKFNMDETVSFKGEKLEHPKIKEEVTAVLDVGYFFITNQRCIYLSEKEAFGIPFTNITNIAFDGTNEVTFTTKKEDILFKFSDDAAEVVYLLFKRIAGM